MLEGFQHETSANGIAAQARIQARNSVLAKTVRQMMAIDKERALIAINLWSEFIERVRAGREFDKLEEYIEWRIDDVGKP